MPRRGRRTPRASSGPRPPSERGRAWAGEGYDFSREVAWGRTGFSEREETREQEQGNRNRGCQNDGESSRQLLHDLGEGGVELAVREAVRRRVDAPAGDLELLVLGERDDDVGDEALLVGREAALEVVGRDRERERALERL